MSNGDEFIYSALKNFGLSMPRMGSGTELEDINFVYSDQIISYEVKTLYDTIWCLGSDFFYIVHLYITIITSTVQHKTVMDIIYRLARINIACWTEFG